MCYLKERFRRVFVANFQAIMMKNKVKALL